MTFEEAIVFSEIWLQDVASGKLSDDKIRADLTQLFQSVDGVRGFFVVFLTGDSPLGDAVPTLLLQGFADNAPQIAAILVKNLAMSTAMMIHHDRNGDATQKAGSGRVQKRSLSLLQWLHQQGVAAFDQERSALLASLKTGTGAYVTFLDRWGYDQAQREAIQTAIDSIV